MDEETLKQILLKENRAFRKAFGDHRSCELELERLRLKPRLSEAEALAERDLKKRKLVLKDRMYRIMQEHGNTR